MNRKLKRSLNSKDLHLLKKNTFNQINASLLNKSNNFLKKNFYIVEYLANM